MPFYGRPTNTRYHIHTTDQFSVGECGGRIEQFTAKSTLLFGDFVYLDTLSGYASKTLESSVYASHPIGIVAGGQSFDYLASDDNTNLIGQTAATAGQIVLVLTQGVGYGIVDATGIKLGAPITAGRTTAGRVRGDTLSSYAKTSAGLAIKAGGSVLVKAVNATQIVVAGVAGTDVAAATDMAALSGTVANGKYNVYVFRVAADGTTVTSAMGTEATTLAGVVWPTGSASLTTLGFVIIRPTGTGGFVGNTTALDDATVVPNAVYVNLVSRKPIIGYALADGGAAAAALKVWIP